MKRSLALGGVFLGTAFAISSLVVVRAEYSPPPRGNSFLCSTGTACLKSKSTGASTPAFLGTSTAGAKNTAIVGTATAGTGVSGSGPTAGVAGTSTIGYGVTGTAGSNGLAGVYGQSNAIGSAATGAGVYGSSSSSSPGVYGISNGGPGLLGGSYAGHAVEGRSTYGDGVYAYGGGASGSGSVSESGSIGGFAAIMQGDNSATYLMSAYNTATQGNCYIDATGDLFCSGSINGALREKHRNSEGQRVLAYSSESASATMEDAGEARMFNGVANVMIPPDFASVIDRGSNYYVFLTPLGDTRGLYVSMKTAAGFQVRENERGRASVAFDYRIVAKPIDATDERLPRAPRTRRPHVVAPPAPLNPLPPLKSQ